MQRHEAAMSYCAAVEEVRDAGLLAALAWPWLVFECYNARDGLF